MSNGKETNTKTRRQENRGKEYKRMKKEETKKEIESKLMRL